MASPHALHQHIGTCGERPALTRGKEVDGLPRNGRHFREDLSKGLVDAPQKFPQLRADVVLRRANPEREYSLRRELLRCLLVELARIEAIELRCLGVGEIDDDDIERGLGRLQKQPAIEPVDLDARIRASH